MFPPFSHCPFLSCVRSFLFSFLLFFFFLFLFILFFLSSSFLRFIILIFFLLKPSLRPSLAPPPRSRFCDKHEIILRVYNYCLLNYGHEGGFLIFFFLSFFFSFFSCIDLFHFFICTHILCIVYTLLLLHWCFSFNGKLSFSSSFFFLLFFSLLLLHLLFPIHLAILFLFSTCFPNPSRTMHHLRSQDPTVQSYGQIPDHRLIG